MHIQLSIYYIIQTLAHREYIACEDTVQELFLLFPIVYPFVSFIISGIQCEPVCQEFILMVRTARAEFGVRLRHLYALYFIYAFA